MYGSVGVEIKKGDLLLNFYTWSSGGVHSRLRVAADFTDKCVVTGAKTKWSNRRETTPPPQLCSSKS